MRRHPTAATTKWISGIGVAVPLILLAAASHAQDQPQWRSGKYLYDNVCGHCHKPEVGVGTVLQGRVLPLEYLKVMVRNGFNAMPAFPDSFVDDASLAELGKYLASLPPVPVPPPKPAPKPRPGATP